MTHVRAQIRDAVADDLSSMVPTIRKSRVFPTDETALPVVNVFTNNETNDPGMGSWSGTQVRHLDLVIAATTTGTEDALDDALDAYAVSIETLVHSGTANDLALDITYRSTTVDASADGNRALGTVILTFDVMYRTIETDPETIA